MPQPFKRILTVDAETRWARSACEWAPDGYTLSKITTEEYIRSPLFKAFGFCFHELGSDDEILWVRHEDLPLYLSQIDWSTTAVLAHNCVTGDHEVRTRAGWVRFDQLEDGVDVLQWCPETQKMTWTPANVVRAPYTGDMYEWDTSFHKGCYTPNHRMFYQTPRAKDWRVDTAERVARMGQNNVYLPTAGVLEARGGYAITALEARVLEMVRADGNVTAAGDARFKFKKERKIARCKALLDGAGVEYGTSVRDGVTAIWTHSHMRMRELTALLGHGRDKTLGAWILDLPLETRQAWLDELRYWDGGKAAPGPGGQVSLHTAKREDAYWLTELAFVSGMSARASFDTPNTRGFSRPDSVLHSVRVRARARTKLLSPPQRVPFAGTVYCLRTATGAFPVRRGGVVWMTGNSMFDVSILSYIYGVRPCFVFDSLSMARALRGVEGGNSLAQLAADYGLSAKGNAVHSTDGLWELPPHVEQELATYCAHDVRLAEQIFMKLLYRVDPQGNIGGAYPPKELRLIDMTVRMYTDPVLELDAEMLGSALEEENAKLARALELAQTDEAELASNDQFAEVLRRLGAEPPTKISKATGKPAFAFAKNDALFQALVNGDNEDVALVCEARLKVKSTLERTRAQRFIDISQRGALPVPLSYYGAATGRWSAAKGANLNLQNLKRGSFLRKAIMAPDGWMLVVGDLSQIEPRVIAWLSGYEDMLNIFRSGEDPYAQFGAQMFNMPGMTKESAPALRQSAKSALLGASYGLSWKAFAAQLLTGFLGAPPKRYTKHEARELGVTTQDVAKFLGWDVNVANMNEIPHTCSEEELLIHCLASKAIIDKYRATAHPVVSFWELLGALIERSLVGGEEYNHKDVLLFRKEEIVMANGMSLRYPNIQAERDEKGRVQYTFQNGRKRQRLFSTRIANNVTQGTARIVMTDGMLAVAERHRPLFTVHDEFCIMVPEPDAADAVSFVKQRMTQPPKWLPGIPLESDVSCARRYGNAK